MSSSQNYSPATTGLLEAAKAEAVRLGHDFVGSEHLLLALLADPTGQGRQLITRSEIDPEAIRSHLDAALKPGDKAIPLEEMAIRSGARKVLNVAGTEARDQGQGAVEPEHVWLALLRERRGVVHQSLAGTGANLDRARSLIAKPIERKPTPQPGQVPAAPRPRPEGEGGRRGRGERPERGERAEKGERPERTTRSERGDRRDRPEREREPERVEPVEATVPKAPRKTAIVAHRNPIFTWRNILLLAVPASIILNYLHAAPVLIFGIACLAVIPLAGYMGEATEHLSHRTGPAMGGFLNATFGNAAELIIAIAALRAGLVDLVKASITGSILGNLLLILGLALIAGSRGRPVIRFNRTAAGMSAAMLALAVVGLTFPAIFHSLHPTEVTRELYMSEGVAVILGITYVFSLLFALKTHNDLFAGEEHEFPGTPWSIGKAIIVLGVATAGVAVESEILVHSVEAVTATLGLSEMFLGLIIIPIIGNAAEHATAVVVARKGKMDLALNIALGSSTQVALLVAPLLVLAGVILGQNMNLVFKPFEVAAIAMSTIVTAIITLDGESHWFEGVQLLAVYAMVAVAAFFI
jgi:Ca2+:H+ antiporter